MVGFLRLPDGELGQVRSIQQGPRCTRHMYRAGLYAMHLNCNALYSLRRWT